MASSPNPSNVDALTHYEVKDLALSLMDSAYRAGTSSEMAPIALFYMQLASYKMLVELWDQQNWIEDRNSDHRNSVQTVRITENRYG